MNIADYIMFGFLALVVFYGIKKGLIKMVINFFSNIIAFLAAAFLAKPIVGYIGDFSIFNGFRKGIEEFFTNNADLVNKNVQQTIDGIAIPDFVKEQIMKGFPDPAQSINAGAKALSERVFQMILLGFVCIAIFILIRIALYFVEAAIEKLFEKIKIFDMANKILGGVVGFADAVLMIYLFLAVLMIVASRMPALTEYVTDSAVVGKLYYNNLLVMLLT